jgi:hypothetical protein
MQGVIATAGFAAIVQWTLWFGASCMVTAGLLSFALSWRTALSAFRDLGDMLSFRSAAAREPGRIEAIEAPMSWFAADALLRPPTATGFPRSSGLSRCSTDA